MFCISFFLNVLEFTNSEAAALEFNLDRPSVGDVGTTVEVVC